MASGADKAGREGPARFFFGVNVRAIDLTTTLADALQNRGPGLTDHCKTHRECAEIITWEVKILIELCIRLADVLIYDGKQYPVDQDIFFIIKSHPDPDSDDPRHGEVAIEITNKMPGGYGRKLLEGGSPIWLEDKLD